LSVGERIGTDLEIHSHGRHALAALLMPRRPITGPHAAALPASIRIVDPAIETLGVEAGGVWHLHGNHFAISESDQSVVEVARVPLPGFGPRGGDIDSKGMVWVSLASGHYKPIAVF
jgi:hypothetical protein